MIKNLGAVGPWKAEPSQGAEAQSLPSSPSPGPLGSGASVGFVSPGLCLQQKGRLLLLLCFSLRLNSDSLCRRRVADVSASHPKGGNILRWTPHRAWRSLSFV